MIIYFDNGNNPFTKLINDEGFSCISPYNKKIKVKIIRILEKYRFFLPLLYNRISLKSKEKIIIFDSNISSEYLVWIKRMYSEHRIIFWYWNPVSTSIDPAKIPEGIEIWSYSPYDCVHYTLKENTTFYFAKFCSNFDIKTHKKASEKKAIFVGADKGRLEMLLNLRTVLNKAGIQCVIYILGDKPQKSCERGIVYYKFIPYEKVINKIIDSDIIIDLYTDTEAGLSLGPIEAVFLGKKLITNNKTIYTYDFYDPTSIYMLGEIRDIHEFLLNKSTDRTEFKEYYSMSAWLKRFDVI